MISTNKTKPRFPNDEGKKLNVLTTNKIKPKEFAFKRREFPGIVARQTRKVPKMLSTSNFEQIKRNEKRKRLMEQVKALKAAKAKRVIVVPYKSVNEILGTPVEFQPGDIVVQNEKRELEVKKPEPSEIGAPKKKSRKKKKEAE